jgi:sugar phosphate permease
MRPFYGWILLAALFVGYTTTNGIVINTLPLLYPVLQAELGFTTQQVTFPATIQFALTAVLALFFGVLLEKYSPRMIMVSGGVLIALGLAAFSFIQTTVGMLLVYVMLAVGLTAGGIVSSMFLIARWFRRYRGRAVGILLMGSSFGTILFPPLAGALMNSIGWRSMLIVLAAITLALVAALFFIVIRNRPEDLGTAPDGIESAQGEGTEAHGSAQAVGQAVGIARGVTLAEAAKTPVFYMLCFVTAAMWFCIVGTINNQTLYFRDLGVAELAPRALSVFGLAAMIGKLLFGWLSDSFSKKIIMLAAAVNLLLGALMLRAMAASPQTMLFPYAVVFGLGFSGAFTMIQVLVAEYYAGASYGRILGVFTFVDTMAGAFGIQTLSALRSSTGSYETPITMMVALCVVSVVIVTLLKKPEQTLEPAAQAAAQ